MFPQTLSKAFSFLKLKKNLIFLIVTIFLIWFLVLAWIQYYFQLLKPPEIAPLPSRYAAQVNETKITKKELESYSSFLSAPNISPEEGAEQKKIQLEKTINNIIIVNEAKNLGLLSEDDFKKINNIWDYNQKGQELLSKVREKVVGWRSGHFIECQYGGYEEDTPEFKERKGQCLSKMTDLISELQKGKSFTSLMKEAQVFSPPPLWITKSFEKNDKEWAGKLIGYDPKFVETLFSLKEGQYTETPLILKELGNFPGGVTKELEFYALIIYVTDSQEGFGSFDDWLASVKGEYNLNIFQ